MYLERMVRTRMKKNNKGLTLVELLITVTILAIVVLPLLRGFVISAQTNAKAKEKLRTTEISKNIMEGINANSLEDVSRQFNYPGNSKENFKVFSNVSSSSEISEFVVNSIDPSLGVIYEKAKAPDKIPEHVTNPDDLLPLGYTSSYRCGSEKIPAKFVGQPSHKYYFGISNLSVGTSNKNYDALITYTATSVDSGTSIDTEEGKKSVNELLLTDAKKIDIHKDAISLINVSNTKVMNLIQEKYNDQNSNIKQKDISRTIHVKIEQEGIGSDTSQKVTVSYEYTGKDGAYKYPVTDMEKNGLTDVVFNNRQKSERVLEHVYLFFEPWYAATDFANSTDTIIIENMNDLDVNVILVKQETQNTNLEEDEKNYKMTVVLKENMPSLSKTNTVINTNLDKNLYNQALVPEGNVQWKLLDKNDAMISPAKSYISGLEDDGKSNLIDKNSGERLFDIKVEIYPAGAFANNFTNVEPINTITGGMAN